MPKILSQLLFPITCKYSVRRKALIKCQSALVAQAHKWQVVGCCRYPWSFSFLGFNSFSYLPCLSPNAPHAEAGQCGHLLGVATKPNMTSQIRGKFVTGVERMEGGAEILEKFFFLPL